MVLPLAVAVLAPEVVVVPTGRTGLGNVALLVAVFAVTAVAGHVPVRVFLTIDPGFWACNLP